MKKRDGGHGMNRRDFLKAGMTGAAASLAFAGRQAWPCRAGRNTCVPDSGKDGPQDNDPQLRRHAVS